MCATRRKVGSLLGEDQVRLRVSARVAASVRSASLTDFESGKASVNSGSGRTALVPRRYLSTYLPRTPAEKSYSALISWVRRLEEDFFIVASLMLCRRAYANQGDPLASQIRRRGSAGSRLPFFDPTQKRFRPSPIEFSESEAAPEGPASTWTQSRHLRS